MNLDLNNPEEVKKYVEEAIKDSEMKYSNMKVMYELAEAVNDLLPDSKKREEELQELADDLRQFKTRIDMLKQLGDLIIKIMGSGSTMIIPNITKESDAKWN